MSRQKGARDSFLHLTDLHFWEIVLNPFRLLNKRVLGAANVLLKRRHEFLTDRAASYAEYAAGLGIRQVLITGDFASTATENEMLQGAAFMRSIEQQGLRPIVIAGNHDVYTFESRRKKRFERHFGPWLPKGPLPCLHTLDGGTPILFVPTVCPNYITSKGRISDAEVRSVEALLDSLDGPLIAAGHYPLLQQTYGYETRRSRRLRNAEALRSALGRSSRQVLYISGHVHRFSYVQDDTYPTLSHLTTGAFFRQDISSDLQGDFSEVRLEKDSVRVIRHVYSGEWVSTEEKKGAISEA